ncbi:BPSL0761 family protein [Paraburkholderia ribeironis]|uniref:BPSL0761 family protein n=1 Tax=Paraburkholderia ribeironis TaxID=1247936 RepID=UPI003183F74C
MTTTYERTRTVDQTRELLEKPASDDAPANHHEVQEEAIRLLPHYPCDFDLELFFRRASRCMGFAWRALMAPAKNISQMSVGIRPIRALRADSTNVGSPPQNGP